MDNQSMLCNTCGHGNMCCGNNCGGHGGGGHHRFFLLRLLLGIAILVIVFKVGVEVGELKGELESKWDSYGSEHMLRNWAPMRMQNQQLYYSTTPEQ